MAHWPTSRRPTACSDETLWSLHLLVARNDRARGDAEAAARSMRSARVHATARQLTKKGL